MRRNKKELTTVSLFHKNQKEMTKDSKFTYLSQPHSAPRFSSTMPISYPLTLMSDPRVVRGNTHALARKISIKADENSKSKIAVVKSKTNSWEPNSSPFYQFECKPFAENDIDMSRYLIDNGEYSRTLTKDVETQIDSLRDDSVKEAYISKKTGLDQETQVENTNDLFCFDEEVKPLLDVIVYKTLEQAVMEVSAEYEVANIQNEIEIYETNKQQEEKWVVDHELLLKEQLERIERERADLERKMNKEKAAKSTIAGVQLMRQILPNIIDDVWKQNLEEGNWLDSEVSFANEQLCSAVKDSASLIDINRMCGSLVDEMLFETERWFDLRPQAERTEGSRRLICYYPVPEKTSEETDEAVGEGAESVVVEMEMVESDSIQNLTVRLQQHLAAKNIMVEISTLSSQVLEKINALNRTLYEKQFKVAPLLVTEDCILSDLLPKEITIYF